MYIQEMRGSSHPVPPLDADALLEAREVTECRLAAADRFGGDDEVGGEQRIARGRRSREVAAFFWPPPR
jgi:hypothetical protein